MRASTRTIFSTAYRTDRSSLQGVGGQGMTRLDALLTKAETLSAETNLATRRQY